MCSDYARENVFGEVELEQDADLMLKFIPPTRMSLIAGAAATAVSLPLGSTAVRFIIVDEVESASGVNVRLGGAGNDPILVKPPDGTDKQGCLILFTNAASVHVDNPSATGAVSFRLALGCTP